MDHQVTCDLQVSKLMEVKPNTIEQRLDAQIEAVHEEIFRMMIDTLVKQP